jgi:hypothetical protein
VLVSGDAHPFRGLIPLQARTIAARVSLVQGSLDTAARPMPVHCFGTNSRHILLRGQSFPQFLRRQLEELPEAQLGKPQVQQVVRRLILAASYSKPTKVPVQTLQVQ